ncbi:hypothetical protein BCR43DRAFT_377179 [Syncephalastrum racemosum]|uniref:Uncharacterized protein n=1 Tax=Syncephalastrum racemosum TaxID=13706 RepID=A0A1X2H4U6_SYNRA|nr:hypothetical protein BCR43DRAFT_377179 [Syncephalastrum racemosum]
MVVGGVYVYVCMRGSIKRGCFLIHWRHHPFFLFFSVPSLFLALLQPPHPFRSLLVCTYHCHACVHAFTHPTIVLFPRSPGPFSFSPLSLALPACPSACRPGRARLEEVSSFQGGISDSASSTRGRGRVRCAFRPAPTRLPPLLGCASKCHPRILFEVTLISVALRLSYLSSPAVSRPLVCGVSLGLLLRAYSTKQ